MTWSDAVLLGCGPAAARLRPAGAPVVHLPAQPPREVLDPVLAAAAPGTRLVVAGTDADLAAVVLRLLRTDRLAELALAYLPARRSSAVATVFGLPAAPRAALALALGGRPVPVPLIRDDVGGVLLGRGELRGVRGEAYCDEHLVLRGPASWLVVSPDPIGGLVVRVRPPGLGRARRLVPGRAVQLACEPARVWRDGVPHRRPVTRWTWYRHTADWLLVRPG